MARGRKPKSQGLGDTIEKITTATGIKAVVKFIAGEDCGCDERKQKLNELFSYKPNCLLEHEYNYVSEFLKNNNGTITPVQQNELLKIYQRVFNLRKEPSTCSSCWRDIVKQFTKLIEVYENN